MLSNEGVIACFGEQITDGRPELQRSVASLRDIRKVATAEDHACIIDGSLRLWCWGDYNSHGLGPQPARERAGGDSVTPEPVHLLPDHRIVDVVVDSQTTCAVTESGHILCFGGYGSSRNFERGPPSNKPWPVRVIGLAGKPVRVAVSRSLGCALDESEAVYCWDWTIGTEPNGQDDGQDDGQANIDSAIANATPVVYRATERELNRGGDNPDQPGSRARDIAVGDNFLCVLRSDRRVVCSGQYLPHRDPEPGYRARSEEFETIEELHDAVTIEAAGDQLCALVATGSVSCWGDSPGRALFDRSIYPAGERRDMRPMRDIRALAVASDAVCVLNRAGEASCWGRNHAGKFGMLRSVPKFSLVKGVTAHRLMVANNFSCAISEGHDVRCWGDFGNPKARSSLPAQSLPEPMPRVPAREIQTMIGGALGRCALQRDGTVRCWSRHDQSENSRLRLELRGVTQLAGSMSTTSCARSRTGDVSCWGLSAGHLGDGKTVQSRVPVPVLGVKDTLDITASVSYGCAVTRTGELWCWGRFRRIASISDGIETIVEPSIARARYRNEPATRVSGITGAAAVVGNEVMVCVRERDQRVRCWHREEHSPPGRDMGLSDVAQLVVTITGACARTFAGRVWCWQADDLRASADLRVSDTFAGIPQPGPYPRPLVDIQAGQEHVCGLRKNGRVVCWGENREGQLGRLPATVEAAPVRAFRGLNDALKSSGQ